MIESTEVAEAYDKVSPIVNALSEGQFHLWYWTHEEDDTALPEAMRRLTRKIADALAPRPGERVLDAGCGSGGPAIQLATEYDVDITGVTISGVQVAAASGQAQACGFGDRVRFEHGDYTALSFPDGAFDVVLAMESLQCAPELRGALDELYRVLRPGGRIGISEFGRGAAMTEEHAAELAAGLHINPLYTMDTWLGLLTSAGFAIEEHTDCGPRVFGSRKWKFQHAKETRRAELVERFGAEAIADYETGLGPFFSPAAEHLSYLIVTASKPIHAAQ